MIDLVQHTCAAAYGGGYGCAGQPQRRYRAEAIDKCRAKYDVQDIGQPERTHSNRSIACTAKYTVDHEQQHNDEVAAQHYLRIAIVAGYHFGCGAHQPQQVFGKEDAGYTYSCCQYQYDINGLHSCV